jgi:ligand-binding sensor domain-containing protein
MEGMHRTTLIFLILVFCNTAKSQQLQPSYLGDASWHKVVSQGKRELVPVTLTTHPIKKITTRDNPATIFQKKIDPGTVILHNGPTVPLIQKIRITGKKLPAPKIFQAPPLQTRDNVSFNVTYTDKKHGFAGDYAIDFAEDEEHNIWIASEKGLIRYDGYSYYLYDLKIDFPDMPDCSLAYDQQKRLWCVSDNGVYFIKNDSLFSIQSPEFDLSVIACKRVMVDRFQRVWISTKNNGVLCIDESAMKIYDKRCGLPGNYFESVYLDKKGNLFMACRDFGIVLIEPGKMRMFFGNDRKMKYNTFLSFYEDEDGIWAGSFLSGMMRLGAKDTIQYSFTGKFSEAIYDIKKAPGGIWISAYGYGLCHLSKNKLLVFNETSGLLNNLPLKIFEDSFQNLWVSNLAGFSRINENSFYLDNYSNPAIGFTRNIIPDTKKAGNWIVTFGRNLVFQKNNEATAYTFRSPSGISPYLYLNAGVLGNDGAVWMGTYGEGIVRATENEFTGYKYSDFTDHGIVVNVKADADNKIWFCPTRYGLIVYDNNKLWRYTDKSGLLSNKVTNLFLDADKKIYWTFFEGLQRFNGADMETFYIGKKLFQRPGNGHAVPGSGNRNIGNRQERPIGDQRPESASIYNSQRVNF